MNKKEKVHVIHPFEPCYDENSRILILGSFPSVKSREMGFYYGHPQNRFWKVLSRIFDCEIGTDIQSRKDFLLTHHLACFDVIFECDIIGSSDASIEKAVCTDINKILTESKIDKIITNGKTAHRLYQQYMLPITKIVDYCMPSTSSANAAWSCSELVECYKKELIEII